MILRCATLYQLHEHYQPHLGISQMCRVDFFKKLKGGVRNQREIKIFVNMLLQQPIGLSRCLVLKAQKQYAISYSQKQTEEYRASLSQPQGLSIFSCTFEYINAIIIYQDALMIQTLLGYLKCLIYFINFNEVNNFRLETFELLYL